jgi:hypothetical protein
MGDEVGRERTTRDPEVSPEAGLIDWGRAARRLGVLAVLWAVAAGLGSLGTAALTGDAATGPWLGVAAFGLGLSAVGVVAVSAVRGMLRAGDRGERLAGDDVALRPPQIRRRRRRDRGRP